MRPSCVRVDFTAEVDVRFDWRVESAAVKLVRELVRAGWRGDCFVTVETARSGMPKLVVVRGGSDARGIPPRWMGYPVASRRGHVPPSGNVLIRIP